MSYESNMARLNEIVSQLESDKLTLEQALDYYKEGIELSVSCKKELENAKLSVKTMSGDNKND